MKTECQKDNLNNVMISSNCNTVLNACDYSNYWKCLAFVSANLINIYDTLRVKSFLTLKGHNQRANSVRWLNNHSEHESVFHYFLFKLLKIGK